MDLVLWTPVLSTPVVTSMTSYGAAVALVIVPLIPWLTSGTPPNLALDDPGVVYLMAAIPVSSALGTWRIALVGGLAHGWRWRQSGAR